MKLPVKQILSALILILLLGFFAYYIYHHASDFGQVKLVNPFLLWPIAVISLIVALTNGLIIKYLVEPFGLKLRFREWFGLSVITTFYNTILPFRGGLLAKAAYLKKNHSFPFTHFIAMMAGIYVINFLVAGFLGLISLLFIYLFYRIFNPLVLMIFASVFLVSVFIALFSPKFPEIGNSFFNKIIKVANGWHLIKDNKKIILVSSFVVVVQILLAVFSTTLMYDIFGVDISFVKALFLASISPLLILVGITPAGLGINEAIAVFSALVIGITPVQSLSVAILGRIVGTAIIFILGPIFSYLLLKRERK